ncbi:MAG: lauroyl acyltransferase [Alphaproteobacteria bacterium]|nr:lauroyl acyltransferase [Alphaproteobacteria bacterium]
MKSNLNVKVAQRKWHERFIKDPLVAVVVLFLWNFMKILPLKVSSGMGANLGKILKYVMPKKHKIALYNLKKCFPEKSDEERLDIANKMWIHFGRMIGEMPNASKLIKNIKVEGAEHLELIKKDGKGGFLASGHVGNWELAGPLTTSLGVPLHLVYRAANNPWIEKYIFQNRHFGGVQIIPKGSAGAKQMIELLKNNEHIGILCDQKLREGIDVPFFGHLAKTAPAIATLSLKFDLPILPARVVRDENCNYVCYYYPIIKPVDTGDKTKDTYDLMLKINQMLEEWIREKPEQWLWIHHRWDKSEYPK